MSFILMKYLVEIFFLYRIFLYRIKYNIVYIILAHHFLNVCL